MSRYRSEVTTGRVYFVEASSPEQATTKAIALAKANIHPEYILEPTADVDVIAETVAA